MKFFSEPVCQPKHPAKQLTHQIYHSGIWYLPILSFSVCLQSLRKTPGSSGEVIRAGTCLFLGTCVHHVFLTKCRRVTVSLLSLTVSLSLRIREEVMFISSAQGFPFVVRRHGRSAAYLSATRQWHSHHHHF